MTDNFTNSSSPVLSQKSEKSFHRVFVSFQYPQFRWLFTGSLAFFFAMQGQILTRSILVWQLTHDEMSLAYVNLAVAIPLIIASIVGGALSDRLDKRQIVLIAQALIVINEVFVLVLMFNNQLEFWHMIVTSFFTGIAIPFIMPARMALTYEIVGPSHLPNALALSTGGVNAAKVVGPATMGLIIYFFNIEGAYITSIVLYSLGMLCMLGIAKSKPREGEKKSLGADISEGFRYILQTREVLVCLTFGLIPVFLAMPFLNLLIVFADEVWFVGERGFGFMMAAAGIGGVLGSYWMARRSGNPKRLWLMFVSSLAFAGFLILFSLSPDFKLAVIFLVVANIFASASQTLNNTALQLIVDDAVRGRISSFVFMSLGFMPLGVLPLAYVAREAGAPIAVISACLLLIVGVTLFYLMSPTLRDMDQVVKDVLAKKA